MFLVMRSDNEDRDVNGVADAVNSFAIYDIAHKAMAVGAEH